MGESEDCKAKQRRWMTILGALVAFAAIVTASCALATMRQIDRINRLEVKLGTGDVERAADLADRSPQNRHLTLSNADGSQRLDVVTTKSGLSYVTGATLPEISDDKAFQLWAVVGESKISVGILPIVKTSIGITSFYMPTGATRLELTLGSSSGAASQTSPPLIVGPVLPFEEVKG